MRPPAVGLSLPASTPRLEPYVRAAQIVLTGLFGVLAIVNLVAASNGWLAAFRGWDFFHYVEAARRWLESGTPYLAHEVARPFQFSNETFLHPPISLLLFAPFTVLPALLYWVIPLTGTAALIAAWRPARWTWPLMALLLNWPRFDGAVIVGNTDLWVVFFIAAGLRFGWPILLLAIKPSVAPFAIVELAALIRADSIPVRRTVEIAVTAAFLLLLAAPFGGLWLEWFAVVRHSPADPMYSIGAIPWLIVPAIAWFGRRRGRRRADVDRGATSRVEDRRVQRQRPEDRGRRRVGDPD
jgi:hypothetical protein